MDPHFPVNTSRFTGGILHLQTSLALPLLVVTDFRLNIRKEFFTSWWSSAGTCSPGKWSWCQAAEVQGVLEQCSVMRSVFFEWPCVEPGVGLNDSCGSIPTHNILCCYGSRINLTCYCADMLIGPNYAWKSGMNMVVQWECKKHVAPLLSSNNLIDT